MTNKQTARKLNRRYTNAERKNAARQSRWTYDYEARPMGSTLHTLTCGRMPPPCVCVTRQLTEEAVPAV